MTNQDSTHAVFKTGFKQCTRQGLYYINNKNNNSLSLNFFPKSTALTEPASIVLSHSLIGLQPIKCVKKVFPVLYVVQ